MLKRNVAIATIIATGLSLSSNDLVEARKPSFEPFFASRMWETVFGPKTPQPVTPELVAQLYELNAVLVIDEPEPEWPTDAPYLNPSLSSGEQTAWQLMPFVMLQLCSLPDDGDWNTTERQMATAILDIVSRVEPQFNDYQVTAAPDINALAQTQACNQFIERASDPQYLAYMIFTLDDGPWTPLELTGDCQPKEEKIITDHFTLRTCQQPSGDWGIEGLNNGELMWQQALSEVPNVPLTFLDMAPIDLGEYGWRINLSFGELTHLYIDQDFKPIFYFTSW